MNVIAAFSLFILKFNIKVFLMDVLANTFRFASKLVNKAFLGHFRTVKIFSNNIVLSLKKNYFNHFQM